MEQARQTLMENAEQAFMRVENKYARPLGLPEELLSPVRQIFHFVEAGRWAYYPRYIAYFNVQKEDAAKVEGITHSYATAPKIGINKCYHTFATLVHESVHYFSHYAFRKTFTVNDYEGATEYLTRDLLNDFGPTRDSHGQGDIYANEFACLRSLMTNNDDRQQLCNAYFTGDKKSISLIKQRLINTHATKN